MQNNYRILLLDTKSSNPNHYICLAIREALSSSINVELVVKADLHSAINLALHNNCNLFFAFDGEELHREICLKLAGICGKSVLWVTEDPYEINKNIANSEIFDLVFTNDSASVSEYGGKGRHLPLAGAKPFHFLPILGAGSLRYDLFFAGTAWPNRVQLLKKFLDGSRDEDSIKTKIALPSNEHLPSLNLALPRSQLNWRTSPVDFARFANMSLCTLVLPRVFSTSGDREFAETPPPRLYEAALAGTVQLVQSNISEANQYFTENKEFIFFDDAEQLKLKIKKLRKEPDLRYEIAKNSQARALEMHCYEHRVATIFSELSNIGLKSSESSESLIKDAQNTVKKRLLYVAHNLVQHGNFGGVEVYLKSISSLLCDDFDIYFYVPNPSNSKGTILLDHDGRRLREYDFSAAYSPFQLSCTEREQAFSSLISEFEISIVHFHHFIGHVPSLIEIAKTLGVRTAYTFHDFYSICHNFTLVSFKGGYCHPEKISPAQCDVCLLNGHRISPGSQAARRAFWDRILYSIDIPIFNTKGGYELVARVFPSLASNKSAVVLPVPVNNLSNASGNYSDVGSGPLKVAILGNFTRFKGGDIISRAIPLLGNSNIEFHIFGRLDRDYLSLNERNVFPNVVVHGEYEPGHPPIALSTCNVSLHLSIWPETYCLTLSEAWDRGLVPVVSDIGALGERVNDGVNGLKILPNSEGELIQALLRLMETPGLLSKLRSGINSAPVSRIDNHIAELKNVYRSMFGMHIKNIGYRQQNSFPLSLDFIQRPLMSKCWAGTSTSGGKYSSLYRRARHLARITKLHYDTYGTLSTLRSCMRYALYVVRKL